MVRTNHDAGVAGAGDHFVGAVLADVVKGPDHIVAAADGKQVLTCDLERKIVADIGNVVGMTGVLPCAGVVTLTDLWLLVH